MPQDGSNNYQYPPGTPGIPDTTIESEAYNTFLDDLVTNDLNIARPVHRGGTGAINAAGARTNLQTEVAMQTVTNYDSHVWRPGSFASAPGATGAPSPSVYFYGYCLGNDGAVILLHAWDASNLTTHWERSYNLTSWSSWVQMPGSLASIVAAADAAYVNVTGDTMSGALSLSGNPTATMHAATKQYVDAAVVRVQTFTASGTYTPHANMLSCIIECVGGGGAGGGTNGASGVFLQTGGGGSGGYSRKYATRATIGASQVVSIGAGGSGVLGGNGGSGGATNFGSLCIANGGFGGPNLAYGTAGAGPGTGDITVGGNASTSGISNAGVLTNGIVGSGGAGAPGPWGGGGRGGLANTSQQTAGFDAIGYGGGGGPASTNHFAAAINGGAGFAGIVIVTEFCSQ